MRRLPFLLLMFASVSTSSLAQVSMKIESAQPGQRKVETGRTPAEDDGDPGGPREEMELVQSMDLPNQTGTSGRLQEPLDLDSPPPLPTDEPQATGRPKFPERKAEEIGPTMRAVVSTAPMAGATPYAANDLEGRVPSNTYEANRDEVGESEGGGSEEEGSEADGSEEGEPAEGSDADVPEEEGSEERTDNNNGYRPPDDVYGIGYREWFEDRLGREPDTVPRLNLGLHYNEYFNEKLEVYSPEYKGSNSIYAGRNPGYTPDGFQTFKTIGPWTTQMYFYGYHTGKIAGAVLKRGAVILTFVPDRRAKVWAVAMMLAASRLPDGLGEVASAYGNIYDNRDVMSYNVRRLLQITPGSNKPFSPWPPLH